MVILLGRRIGAALISALYAISVYASADSFENMAIVRSAELGGSMVHVTSTYAVKALKNDQTTYRVALGAEEKAKTSWIEAKVKGQRGALNLKEHAFDSDKYESFVTLHPYATEVRHRGYHFVDIVLPRPLGVNKTITIVLETMQTHTTWPCPATAAQAEGQALKYKTDLFVLSPYHTVVQRTKIK
jgi:oligosaccharyltransferase complex subunit alpha (ribophorin I)